MIYMMMDQTLLGLVTVRVYTPNAYVYMIFDYEQCTLIYAPSFAIEHPPTNLTHSMNERITPHHIAIFEPILYVSHALSTFLADAP